MSNYIRARYGNTFFFTVVTYRRQPILCSDLCRAVLRKAIKKIQTLRPFEIKAFVLLPEHMHCIWQLPAKDTDYSTRWGLIKKEFTQQVKGLVGSVHPTKLQKRRREGTIWQKRFWEHQIKDQRDFNVHCDYIHYNPVKHGLAKSPVDWPYSTFHRFMDKGIYSFAWGAGSGIRFDEHIGKE